MLFCRVCSGHDKTRSNCLVVQQGQNVEFSPVSVSKSLSHLRRELTTSLSLHWTSAAPWMMTLYYCCLSLPLLSSSVLFSACDFGFVHRAGEMGWHGLTDGERTWPLRYEFIPTSTSVMSCASPMQKGTNVHPKQAILSTSNLLLRKGI